MNTPINLEDGPRKNFKLEDLKKPTKLGWMVIIFFSISANCFHQFMNIATDLFTIRFGFSMTQAKNSVAMIRFMSVFFIPLLSLVVTKIGRKGYFMILASLIAIINPLMLSLIPKSESYLVYFGVVGICLYWAVQVCSVWPSMGISLP